MICVAGEGGWVLPEVLLTQLPDVFTGQIAVGRLLNKDLMAWWWILLVLLRHAGRGLTSISSKTQSSARELLLDVLGGWSRFPSGCHFDID